MYSVVFYLILCSNLLNSYLPDVEFFCGHRFESGADIPLKAFHQSVRNDIMAAKGVTDNLNPNKLREFVKAIDECQGQILISGIGELLINFTTWKQKFSFFLSWHCF